MPQLRYPNAEAKPQGEPMPGGDLISKMMSLLGMGPTDVPTPAAITGFRTPVGLPDKPARQAATQVAMSKLKAFLDAKVGQQKISPHESGHTMAMAEKYPRTMAHVSEFVEADPGKGKHPIQGVNRRGFQADPLERDTMSEIGLNNQDYMPKTLVHELVHAAQRIREPKTFQDKYGLYNLIMGYGNNPYEVRANLPIHPRNGRVIMLPNQRSADPFYQQLLQLQDIFNAR